MKNTIFRLELSYLDENGVYQSIENEWDNTPLNK